MRLPFQIYDFISILFPGIIALTILKIEFPNMELWSFDNQYGQLTVFFALAYIIGHLLQGVSRVAFTHKFIRKKVAFLKGILKGDNKLGNKALDVNGSLLRGRHYDLPVSDALANEIEQSFTNFYDIELKDINNREDVFGLIYAPINDKMAQRHIFVAIANLHRGITVISSSYIAYILIFKIPVTINSTKTELLIPHTIGLLAVLVVIKAIASRQTHYFKKLSDKIPYYAFLAWEKERKNND